MFSLNMKGNNKCFGKRVTSSFLPFPPSGQKFGMLEMKVMLSNFLRQYRIESIIPREEIKVKSEIVLRPNDGTLVRLYPRREHCNSCSTPSKCESSGGMKSAIMKDDYNTVRRR